MNNMKKMGWLPDVPDRRDASFSFENRNTLNTDFKLPTASQFTGMSGVENQTTNSCVAKAVVGAMEYLQAKTDEGRSNSMELSSRFLYYYSRENIGTQQSDSGSFLRDALKVAKSTGVPNELFCPDDAFMVTTPPTRESIFTPLRYYITEYQSITEGLQSLLTCLAKRTPVVFGFSVYYNFMFSGLLDGGMMPFPGPSERMIGGHAVCAIGFDQRKQAVLVRNSWGKDWGLDGYFWMPYSFIGDLNYACDFWAIPGVRKG